MKNIKALIKLDFQFVSPYWKWLVFYLGISILFGILNQDGAVFALTITIFAMTVMFFPFEVTEKNNLNILYGALPTNRQSVIFARYCSSIILLVVSLIIAFAGSIIINAAFGNGFNATMEFLFLCISAGVYLVINSWQMPVFFRRGYLKGRLFAWIPAIIFIVLINLPALLDLFNVEFGGIFVIMIRNPLVTSLISVFAGIAAFIVSYFVSRILYLYKDM